MNLSLLVAVSLFAGVLPMVCWSAIVWWFDRYEKEPLRLLLIAFLWGMIPAAALSIILELPLGLPGSPTLWMSASGYSFLGIGVLSPVIEEAVKLIGLLAIFRIARQEVDDPLDGIIYGAMVGFGFAAAENTLYFLTSRTVAELLLLIFLRAMIFGAVHALFTAFSGLGLALAKYARSRWRSFLWAGGGFADAVVFHFLHNLGIYWAPKTPWGFYLSAVSFGVGFLILVMLFIGSLLRERKVIRKYLQSYAQQGILEPGQWENALSVGGRLHAEWSAIRSFDLGKYASISRIYTIYAELAFKEKQRQLWGENPSRERQIHALVLEMGRLLDNRREKA